MTVMTGTVLVVRFVAVPEKSPPAVVTPGILATLFDVSEVLIAESIENAAPQGKADEIKFIVDPKSAYVESAAFACGRDWDDAIIAASTSSTSMIGQDAASLTSEDFTVGATNPFQVAVSFGGTAATSCRGRARSPSPPAPRAISWSARRRWSASCSRSRRCGPPSRAANSAANWRR